MPIFQYVAVDPEGLNVRGQLEADEQVTAIQMVSALGLVPIEVKEGASKNNVAWWQYDIQVFGPKVPRRELVTFFQSFATLIEADLPVRQVLVFTREQIKSRLLKAAVSALENDVANGRSLAGSMEKYPDIFPKRVTTVLEIGERSNTLQLAATNAANMLESEDTIRREINSALIYPAILMVMATAVIGVVLFHLTPTIAPVFETAGAELPWTLVQMLNLRAAILDYWMFWLAGIVLIALLFSIFKKRLTKILEPVILRIPVVGSYIRERETHRIAESLALMLQSGATITQALSAAKDSVNWSSYRILMEKTEQSVIAGGKLSGTLALSPIIAPVLKNLIAAGEESDRLQQVLQTASKSLGKTSNEQLQLAVKLLTPLLTLLIGALVGGMIFSTITAILDLNDIAF